MRAGVRSRASGVGTDSRSPSPVARLLFPFFAVAVLVVPIFAHGCHGDDVDHEPSVVLPGERSDPGR